MENPKWRTAVILKINRDISQRLTNFAEVWRGNSFGSYAPVLVLQIYDFKNPIWQMFL